MTVHISDGLRIDDNFAARLVDHMLTHLAKSNDTVSGLVGRGDYRSSFGNPKGQRRIYARLLKNQHPSLLAANLTTGTRMRFSMALDMWDATASSDDGTGPLSWLVASRVEFHSFGPGKCEDYQMELVALSRHALERLVQRGAVKTPEDFIKLLRRAWSLLSMALMCGDRLPKDGSVSWVLPVTADNGEHILLPVVRNTGKGPVLIVPTALTWDMGIDHTALEPLLDLLMSYEGEDPAKLIKDPRLPDAFMATARATRKGRRQA